MFNMSHERLRKIEQIKKEWADEVRKIDSEKPFTEFNQEKQNREYKELEEKYLPRLLELMEG